MDPIAGFGGLGGAGFPRRRGDEPEVVNTITAAVQFPPQARGWTHEL